jgi:hypothetical protein
MHEFRPVIGGKPRLFRENLMSDPRRAQPHEFTSAEYETLRYVHRPAQGVGKDDLTSPSYWSNFAKMLRPWTRIEVRAYDGSFLGELVVRAVEPYAAKVEIWAWKELGRPAGDEKIAPPPGYDFKHRGKAKWTVVRLADNVVLQDGLASELDAAVWLRRHLDKLA